jgi:4'-phosphopantetheinyl transferase
MSADDDGFRGSSRSLHDDTSYEARHVSASVPGVFANVFAMFLTPSLPSAFQLASDEVHSWCASLDVPADTAARLYATLTPDERDRSARFRFERDRRRFIVARGVLRDLLGRYLQTEPGQIRFVYNAFGKPDLTPESGDRLRFNLSHSADLALIAIATVSSVGVDLEYVRWQSDYADIARRFFSAAEVDYLSALPSHLYAEAFFSCWTMKEAYLKACGKGLAVPLNSFSVLPTTDPAHTPVDLLDLRVASSDTVRAARWSLYTLRLAPGYAGALALEGTGWRLSQWQWRMPEPAGARPLSS